MQNVASVGGKRSAIGYLDILSVFAGFLSLHIREDFTMFRLIIGESNR